VKNSRGKMATKKHERTQKGICFEILVLLCGDFYSLRVTTVTPRPPSE
jgi:hypothetical protein